MSRTSVDVRRGGELSLAERSLSVGTGLFLAALAAKPRPNVGLSLLVLGAGAFLAYRGATGTCPIRRAIERR